MTEQPVDELHTLVHHRITPSVYRVDHIDALAAAGQEIRGWVIDAPLPKALDAEIRSAYARLCDEAGAQDVSTPPERAEELVDGIAGAGLEVLDAAHLSNVEQAADFTTALVRFLAD